MNKENAIRLDQNNDQIRIKIYIILFTNLKRNKFKKINSYGINILSTSPRITSITFERTAIILKGRKLGSSKPIGIILFNIQVLCSDCVFPGIPENSREFSNKIEFFFPKTQSLVLCTFHFNRLHLSKPCHFNIGIKKWKRLIHTRFYWNWLVLFEVFNS